MESIKKSFPSEGKMLEKKYGISRHLINNEKGVIYGSRIRPSEQSSGWFIWMGEKTDDEDFFLPLHGSHFLERYSEYPALERLLSLAPGHCFLFDTESGYTDVWQDFTLLLPLYQIARKTPSFRSGI